MTAQQSKTQERLKINPMQKIITEIYEPVTGSHVGPRALALFFFKKEVETA